MRVGNIFRGLAQLNEVSDIYLALGGILSPALPLVYLGFSSGDEK